MQILYNIAELHILEYFINLKLHILLMIIQFTIPTFLFINGHTDRDCYRAASLSLIKTWKFLE